MNMKKDEIRLMRFFIAMCLLVVIVFLYKAIKESKTDYTLEKNDVYSVESERLIRPKQPEIVIVETSEESTEEIPKAENGELRLLGTFKVSAYCSCEKCCGKWSNTRSDGIVYGASGVELTANHSIAVDTSVIPYGKSVFIDGKEYVAEDCGGAIKGNKIDIYMETHEEAVNFGVKNLLVYEREY